MGRAIVISALLVLCSFAFVFVQLWVRRPAVAGPLRSPNTVLETREDGSVYAVSLQIEKFEKRLAAEEKRWIQLQTDLEAIRKERDELKTSLEDVQSELRRLRRQVAERRQPTAPAPAPAPGNGPDVPVPVPVPDPTDGTQ
jgi:septal ring factor EnvC (AmiA/AmiB activator)